MHLRSKLTSEICQKVERLDGKTTQNHLKAPNLSSFSQITAVFIEKRLKLIDFYVQN